jgi:hypothetical protein
MSRKGGYNGGGTVIGPRDGEWFSKDSVSVPSEPPLPKRERTAAQEAQKASLKKNPGPELIKADDPRVRNIKRRKPLTK